MKAKLTTTQNNLSLWQKIVFWCYEICYCESIMEQYTSSHYRLKFKYETLKGCSEADVDFGFLRMKTIVLLC